MARGEGNSPIPIPQAGGEAIPIHSGFPPTHVSAHLKPTGVKALQSVYTCDIISCYTLYLGIFHLGGPQWSQNGSILASMYKWRASSLGGFMLGVDMKQCGTSLTQ